MARWLRVLVGCGAAVWSAAGCGSSDGGSSDGASSSGSSQSGSGGAGSSSGSHGSSGSGGPTGPGDGDWQKAYREGGVGISCALSFDELVEKGAPSVTRGDTTLFVGFEQIGDNQDPVLVRFDGKESVYCIHHEQQSPDARALGVTWDGGPTAYIVYFVTGGGTAFDDLAKGGWVSSYGDGGGSSKVAVLGSVDTQSGAVQRATFVPAKRDDNRKTNTLSPADAVTVLTDGTLELLGASAFGPLNPDKSAMCVPDAEYPAALDGAEGPNYLARFSADLSTVVCASTAGCSQITTPCP